MTDENHVPKLHSPIILQKNSLKHDNCLKTRGCLRPIRSYYEIQDIEVSLESIYLKASHRTRILFLL